MSSTVILEPALTFLAGLLPFLVIFGGTLLAAFLEQRADRAPRHAPDPQPAPVARSRRVARRELAYHR